MSTRRPPSRTDRTPPAPTTAARGVVLVIVAAGLGLLLLAKALDGPSSADIEAGAGPGGAPAAGVTTTVATTIPATTTTVAPVYDPTVKVVVANASGRSGAAGRMQEQLGADLGALLGNPTNQPDGAPDLDATTVYFTTPTAEPSARAIAAYLTNTTTQVPVASLPSTDLVENGDIQDAGVVILLGRDLATEG